LTSYSCSNTSSLTIENIILHREKTHIISTQLKHYSHITNSYPFGQELISCNQQFNTRTNSSVISTSIIPNNPHHHLPSRSTMCRARLTTYLLCGCIHKHQDFCTLALKASTKVEWDAVHVCSDWDKASTHVHENVSMRCPLHAKEFLERGGGGGTTARG
jgi:hypothetical protein